MLQQLQKHESAVIYLTKHRMLSHSALSGADGGAMDICKASYEVTGDQCKADIHKAG